MRAQNLFPVPLALFLSAVASGACGGGAAASGGPGTPSATSAATPIDPSLPKPATKPDSAKVTWKKDAAPKSCHTGAKSGDLAANVTAMANGCIDKKMHQVGQPVPGEGSREKMVQSIPLKAEANHCYRVFGLAEASVTDFDIAIMDSTGKSAGEDLLDSNDAIVLEDGVICFKEADTASINVAVAAGAGKWAISIWAD